jgi:IS30 family transposase
MAGRLAVWGSCQHTATPAALSAFDADDLARIAASLNNRPRNLGFMKPSEKLAELVATTG